MNIILLSIYFSLLFSIIPDSFNISDLNEPNQNQTRTLENDLADDSIVDLRWILNSSESIILAGTSGGLSRIDLNNGSVSFSHYVDDSLPAGGNPAMDTFLIPSTGETMVVVSGVLSEFVDFEDDIVPYGTGIAWSLDSGANWYFSNQPVDQLPNCENIDQNLCSPLVTGCSWNPVNGCSYQGSYVPFDWYGQTAYSNPITTEFKNVTYDISVDIERHYIYIASWAGMLRRLKYTDFEPEWELVPLPEDIEQIGDSDSFLCGQPINQSYVYNPVDGSGDYNHKVFSVLVENDNIWAGTANGINKGIVSEDGCIDWLHQTTLNSNIAGDWIIDVVLQEHISFSQSRIWLISREVVSPPAPHGLSYSDDSGVTWNIVDYFNDIEEGGVEPALVYNLYFSESSPEIFASTSIGLYISNNQNEQVWQRVNEIPDNCFNDTYAVFSNIGDDFIGTPNGLIYECNSDGCGDGWCNDDYINLDFPSLSVYPNPASRYTNFIYKTDISSGHIDIFDFSMRSVASNINCYQGTPDDGQNYLKCDYDNINLANGVYFCRLSVGKREVWEKLMIINN